MRTSLIALFLCAASLLCAQPVVIDGELSDLFWNRIPEGSLTPVQAGVPAAGGEVRSVLSGRYLYLSARMPEPTGRFTARSIGKNPRWEEEDAVVFSIRSAAENDWRVRVGPLGAWSVEWRWTGEPEWYAGSPEKCRGILAAATSDEQQWSAEIAIPLSKLGSPPNGGVQASVERVRAARPGVPEERWRWPVDQPLAKVPGSPLSAGAPDPVFRPPSIGNSEAPIEVGFRSALPGLESGWNDGGWRDVSVWSLYRNQPGRHLPLFPSEVKMMHNGHTLAIMARCTEDGTATADDNFQVYLATSGSAYVKYSVNPAGTVEDATGFSGGPRISRPNENWESPVRGAARQMHGEWVARLDLPLDFVARALGEIQTPNDWRILLVRRRARRTGEPPETSVLPVTQTITPFCPARYRRLSLTKRDPSQAPGEQAPPPSGNLSYVPSRVLSAGQRKEMAIPKMLDRNIHDRTLKILQAERTDWERVRTLRDWENFRDPKLTALAASLGTFPPRRPLDARVIKQYRGDGYRREDLVYQSRPGQWVTANLYLPSESKPGMPGIVIAHSLHAAKTQFELQDMGILWARAGCAVLVIDQAGYGERLEGYPWAREFYHSRYVTGMQLYLAGGSLIQWMAWDLMRAIDLLLARKDVDEKQIILLGAVAGGGDPAAVVAALDRRVSAVAPFNFGESTPEIPRFIPEKNQWPLELADPGLGDWDTTRCLRRGVVDQFLQWTICAMAAPRRFVYSYELGWNVEDLPAWARYKKVWSLYWALDHLADAHGFGPFPGPGECWNIGPAQRRSLYPALERWFGIPLPFEAMKNSTHANLSAQPDERRPETELMVLSPQVAGELHMRTIHEIAAETGSAEVMKAREMRAAMSSKARQDSLRADLAKRLGDIEPAGNPRATMHWSKSMPQAAVEGITIAVEPDITVPLLLFRPTATRAAPVVVGVAEGGKEMFLADRGEQIEALLKAGVAVCLPDVRGTGETAPDSRRDAENDENEQAVNEQMLGETLVGRRLKDLRTVLVYLRQRRDVDGTRIGLWGESLVPVNSGRMLLDELPLWQAGPQIQQQGEPLGGLLALLGSLYEPDVRTVAVRGGLASYASILDDAFAYVPADAIVPGFLEVGDLVDVEAALAPRPVFLEDLIDGKDRLIPERSLRDQLQPAYEAYGGAGLVVLSGHKKSQVVERLVEGLRADRE